jgi:poly(3-hydroxyalkanoate) synthetase
LTASLAGCPFVADQSSCELVKAVGYIVAQVAGALLIVAGPIKRTYMWDLTPSVSVVRRHLAQGRRLVRFSRNPAKQTKWHQAMWRGGASTGIPSKPCQQS